MAQEQDIVTHPLNLGAFGALYGYSSDWRAKLVDLLRSDVPISIPVRDALADTIEGKNAFGLSITLSGHQAQSKRIDGLEARSGWLREGLEVSEIVGGLKVEEGFALAESRLGKDDSHCRKRYYYWENCRDWIASARKAGGLYAQMTDSQLEGIWHRASYDQKNEIKPVPLSSAEFDEMIAVRLRFLEESNRSSQRPMTGETRRLYFQAMMAMFDLAPQENG